MALDNNKKTYLIRLSYHLKNYGHLGGCYLQHSSSLSTIPQMILSLIQ